jgi:8-oxo-dGTP pyrophosphatase MutT (NUDIX family)
MIKILFNDKKILLTEHYQQCLDDLSLKEAHILFNVTKDKILQCLDLLMISEINHVVIEGNEADLLNGFRSIFKTIVAAGGVVTNGKNQYLFIFRRGKWDLPKGKREDDEGIEICALREVMEETGIKDVAILAPLINTYHIYLEGEFIFKETYWYLMQSHTSKLEPQLDEGITKALWIHEKNISFQLNKTYESVRDLMAFTLRHT